MCGILCCLSPTDEKLISFTDRLEKIKHRGPDETNVVVVQSPNLTTFTCGFHRLAIANVLNGEQPIENKEWVHVHNGEFYNEEEVEEKDEDGYLVKNVIMKDSYMLENMTIEGAISFPKELDGIFAYCSYHKDTETLFVARDRFGVIPLYYVVETEQLATANDDQIYERIWFASEAKALIGLGDIHMFPPNTVMKVTLRNTNTIAAYHAHMETHEIHPPFPTENYYEPIKHVRVGRTNLYPDDFFIKLREAVGKRMQDEVPWGTALSGGLDSTIISSLLNRLSGDEYDGTNQVRSYSIGLQNCNELGIAKAIGTHFGEYDNISGTHYTIKVTVEEALEVVPDVIWALETYDVTTIRAGVMNYLLAKNMKKFGTKVVYSGEGSDEIFGGYLYFHHCPTAEHMQYELKRKLNELCYYDCLRCNKAFAAWGIECRVPFLDLKFVTHAMKMDPKYKLSSTFPGEKRPEKYILRKNFQWHLEETWPMGYDNGMDIETRNMFCWRQKDQFSDSVGKEWIQGLIEEAEKCVTDTELKEAEKIYPFQTPKTKEAYRYRKIFEELFLCSGKNFVKYDNNTVACSTSIAAEWCKDIQKDPSGNYVKESINKK